MFSAMLERALHCCFTQVVTGGEVDPAPAELGHAGAGGFSNDTFMLNTARFVC